MDIVNKFFNLIFFYAPLLKVFKNFRMSNNLRVVQKCFKIVLELVLPGFEEVFFFVTKELFRWEVRKARKSHRLFDA